MAMQPIDSTFEELSLTDSECDESFEILSLLSDNECEDTEESFEELSLPTDEAQKTAKMLQEFMASEDYLAPSNPGNLLISYATDGVSRPHNGFVEFTEEVAMMYGWNKTESTAELKESPAVLKVTSERCSKKDDKNF